MPDRAPIVTVRPGGDAARPIEICILTDAGFTVVAVSVARATGLIRDLAYHVDRSITRGQMP